MLHASSLHHYTQHYHLDATTDISCYTVFHVHAVCEKIKNNEEWKNGSENFEIAAIIGDHLNKWVSAC